MFDPDSGGTRLSHGQELRLMADLADRHSTRGTNRLIKAGWPLHDFQGRPRARSQALGAQRLMPPGPRPRAPQPMARTWADWVRDPALAAGPGGAEPGRRGPRALGVTGQGEAPVLCRRRGRAVSAMPGSGSTAVAAPDRRGPKNKNSRPAPASGCVSRSPAPASTPCQQGVQLAHMLRREPERLAAAATAMHCKDWLYLNLTGERATDRARGQPSPSATSAPAPMTIASWRRSGWPTGATCCRRSSMGRRRPRR